MKLLILVALTFVLVGCSDKADGPAPLKTTASIEPAALTRLSLEADLADMAEVALLTKVDIRVYTPEDGNADEAAVETTAQTQVDAIEAKLVEVRAALAATSNDKLSDLNAAVSDLKAMLSDAAFVNAVQKMREKIGIDFDIDSQMTAEELKARALYNSYDFVEGLVDGSKLITELKKSNKLNPELSGKLSEVDDHFYEEIQVTFPKLKEQAEKATTVEQAKAAADEVVKSQERVTEFKARLRKLAEQLQ